MKRAVYVIGRWNYVWRDAPEFVKMVMHTSFARAVQELDRQPTEPSAGWGAYELRTEFVDEAGRTIAAE